MLLITPDRVTHALALVVTVAILWSLQIESYRTTIPTPEDHGVQLSLLEEPPRPEAPKPEPERPKPRRPTPATPHRAAERAVAAEAPAPILAAAVGTTAVSETAAAMPPPATPASHATVEDEYAAAVRRNVDARTAVPTSSEYRLLKPSGAAQIRFALDRVGSPSDVAVAHTSGSGILDRQALTIVASGHYPPFPEAAYPGETRHVFLVTIEFRS